MGSGGGGYNEQFPVGMRVLAVDDDPTCLKVLEALLLRCRYHVTTTNQATVALKLLRENRNKFDLIISDVHMPGMDGFKLLELVGLEMDLPVIMLSVNGETKSVMKGITHGACDYLLKPVRIEELKNIWQHVVRRKFSHRDFGNFDNWEVFENHQSFYNLNGQDLGISELSYQNGSLSRKRKDRNEEDDDDFEENMHEIEDSTSHKKPRVVWSIELHQKFVAAVNQLGIDKAVPKRILDLMNAEKLTRENVASHLQKYRLYLKRLSTAANQPASMVAAFRGRESSYLHRSSSGGFENSEVLPASYQLPSLKLSESRSVLGRANTSVMGFCGHTSSEIVQVGHMTNNTSIPTEDLIVFQQVNHQSNQHGILLHGIPTSLELEALQPKRVQEECIHLPGSENSNVNLNNSFVGVTSNPLALKTFQHQTHSKGFINCSPATKQTVNSDSFHENDASYSYLPDNARWQCALPVTEYANNNTSLVGSLTNAEYLPKSMDKFPISQGNNNVPSVCSSSIIMPDDPLKGRDGNFETYSSSRQTMVMPTKVDRMTKFSNFGSSGDSKHRQELAENIINQHDIMLRSCSRSTLCNIFMTDPISGKWRMNNSHQKKMIDKNNISPVYANPLNHSKNCNVDKSNSDCLAKDKYNMQAVKLHREISGDLEDLVGHIIKPESNEISLADYENGIDCYSLGACM